MIEFTMPSLGSDMDEGKLTEWLVKEGDAVRRGQVVAVVETTKAAVDIECWHDGTVAELLVSPGETVQVGTALATLIEPGEGKSTPDPSPIHAAAGPTATEHLTSEPVQRLPREVGARRWVSPAARRLAAAKGVDLEVLTGTGLHGAITLEDVEQASAAGRPAAQEKPSERRDIRSSIAAAMSRSKREIPHYYLEDSVPMRHATAWLTECNAQRSVVDRLLPTVLQIKAVAVAAARYGEFNGFWRDGEFRASDDVHVGVAISLRGGGLVAPAIHDVPAKSLDQLMAELSDLVLRARAGTLRSSEMSDPTITVTSLGDKGVRTVFGVIYPPQVALVGFGKVTPQVCVVDDGIHIMESMQITLAADHRASDGHRGALFLSAVNQLLQEPESLAK